MRCPSSILSGVELRTDMVNNNACSTRELQEPRVAARARKIFWIAWPILTAIGLVLVGIDALNSLGSEGQFVNTIGPTSEMALVKGVQAGQTFVAPRAGLEQIDVLLYGYWRRNTQPVIFHLREAGVEQDKVTVTFDAGEVLGWQWRTFRFDPLADSKGKTYYFFLESPTSTSDDALMLGGILGGDLYPNGTAQINGQSAFADVAFMTYYADVSLREKLSALAHKLSGAKPSLWGDARFYIAIGCLYLLLVIGLVRWLAAIPARGSPSSLPSKGENRHAQGSGAQGDAPILPPEPPLSLAATLHPKIAGSTTGELAADFE
jgi:hypothetical protein